MFCELLPFLTFRALPLEIKGRVYASCVRSSIYILSVYSSFSDRVGLPLHNTPFPGVLMKSIGATFFRPDALPDVNHMVGSMTYGSETRPLLVDVGLKFERAQMIRWLCGVSKIDRRTSKKLRRLVGIEPITTVIRSGRLRWYGHGMRKSDEEWVKKCIEFKVEGRRPVRSP